jgi:hypothetical protein
MALDEVSTKLMVVVDLTIHGENSTLISASEWLVAS